MLVTQRTCLSFKLLGGNCLLFSFYLLLGMFYTEGYNDELEEMKRYSWVGYIYPCWRELPKHLFTLYMAPRDQRHDSTQVHLSEQMKDYLEEHGWLTYRQLCLQKACTTHKSCMIETPTAVHIPSPIYLSISIYGLYIRPLYILSRTACSHAGLQAAGDGMYWNADVVVICAKNWRE